MNILDYPDNIPNEVRELLSGPEPDTMEQFEAELDKLDAMGYNYMRTPGQIEVFDVMPKSRVFELNGTGVDYYWIEDIEDEHSVWVATRGGNKVVAHNNLFIAKP